MPQSKIRDARDIQRPTREELAEAVGKTVPDVIAPGLRVLFCGINPGVYSGATGHHFARPGNRFWRTLYEAGFTDRVLWPAEERDLLAAGLGITNLVERTTASAAELGHEELRAGAAGLRTKVVEHRPRWLAVLGVSAFRVGFDRPRAAVGRQSDAIGETGVWVLPNPSGLNAHYQLPELVAAYRRLRDAAG